MLDSETQIKQCSVTHKDISVINIWALWLPEVVSWQRLSEDSGKSLTVIEDIWDRIKIYIPDSDLDGSNLIQLSEKDAELWLDDNDNGDYL